MLGHLGENTFYYSSSDFQEDLEVSVRLFTEKNQLLIETSLSLFETGIYQFDYYFSTVGKYLVILSQDGKPVLLCTIMVIDLTPRSKSTGVYLPGII